MAKLTLTDLTQLSTNENSAVNTINANNAAVEAALELTLSRDGSSPNSMAASLDMNSNRIINLPAPASDHEPARKVDITNATTTGSVTVGTTLVGGGTNNKILYDNSGYIGEATVGTGLSLSGGTLSATGTNDVTSVAGRTGAVTLSASDISGLSSFATGTDAANLTGTVSVNRFNSGTGASGTTFLKGDGTWGTPSGTSYTGEAVIYDTVTAATAANLSGASSVMVMRYSTSTPYSTATYVKLGSAPSPVKAWHFRDNAGAGNYYELRTDKVTPEMLGAVRDNSTNDQTALQAAIDYALAFGAIVQLTGFYASTSTLTKADGTDPGALIIQGTGMDVSGITFGTVGNNAFNFLATGSNRNVGIRLSNFKIAGSYQTAVYICNALDCVFDMLHIVNHRNHAFFLDQTVGYGSLRVTIRDCKTSPLQSAAGMTANARSVYANAGNYVTVMNNYFSGYVDGGANNLSLLIESSCDSLTSIANIFESCISGFRMGASSNASIHDHMVGSAISSYHYVIPGNYDATILFPRGTGSSNINNLASSTYANIYLERVGALTNYP